MRASRNQERSSGIPSLRAGWSSAVSPPPAMTCNSLLIAAGASPGRMWHELKSVAGDNPIESGPQFLCASRKASTERLRRKSAKGRKTPRRDDRSRDCRGQEYSCRRYRGRGGSRTGCRWPGTYGAESHPGALPIPPEDDGRCHEGVQSTSLSVMFETVSSTPPSPQPAAASFN
jgi:hypothetical protein